MFGPYSSLMNIEPSGSRTIASLSSASLPLVGVRQHRHVAGGRANIRQRVEPGGVRALVVGEQQAVGERRLHACLLLAGGRSRARRDGG